MAQTDSTVPPPPPPDATAPATTPPPSTATAPAAPGAAEAGAAAGNAAPAPAAAPTTSAATPAAAPSGSAPAPAATATPAQAAAASGAPVRNIVVEGTQRSEPSTVLSYMVIRVGDGYTPAAADQSLKALFATGLFSDVKMSWDGSTLKVRVVENPILNQVVFEGNDAVAETELTKEVQVKPRQVFTRARVQADVQRLIEVYRRQGYFAATVEPKIIQRPQNRVDLVFEIREGPTTGIARIRFIGNKVFNDDDLKSQIATTESVWWKFLATEDNYDPDRLTFDREQLRRFYLDHGYADFRVISAVAELTPDRSDFFVTYTVSEGEQYRFGKIEVESHIKELKAADLLPLVRTYTGDVYNATKIEKSIEALTFAAGSRGFVFIDIHPRVKRDSEKRVIDVVFRIEQGPRVYVERINISGNTRTRDNVIRRQMRLAEGDAFNRVLEDRSRTRIRALGFFKDVAITEERGSTPDRTVLNVKVTEQATGSLSLGVGFSSQENFLVDFSYTEQNLFGRGQFMRAGISLSAIQQQFDFRFTEPYFMNQPLAAGFQIYKVYTDFSDFAGYTSDSTAFGLLFGFPVSEYGRLSPHYTYRIDSLDTVTNAPIEIRLAEGTASTSLIGFTYTYDTLDDPIRPKNGLVFSINQDLAGVGGDLRYVRTELAFSYYEPIFDDDWIGSFSISTGYITGYGGQNVRINERFFKGGDSFRGFSIAGVGPRDTNAAGKPALGAELYAFASAEVRLPKILPEDYGMDFWLFTDFGVIGKITGQHTACSPAPLPCVRDELAPRASAGLTVAWKSPFGPVKIDLSLPFLKEDYDKTQTIHFGAAHNF
jgi:outer membrane protein insertion porin family